VVEGGKQPYAIARQDGQPMAFAGLWESFRWPDATVTRTFTIITTTPNAEMSKLHDRMPVILDQQDWTTWLGEAEATAQRCCVPLPTGYCVCCRSIGALARRGTTGRSCWRPSPHSAGGAF
jgi:putative SOS response-associated peptidase YedK